MAADSTSPDPLPRPVKLKDGRTATLRHVREDDAAEICALLPITHRESDNLNFLPGEFDWTVQQERDYLAEQRALPHLLHLAVELEGRIIALVGAKSLKLRRYVHHAELGLTVLKDYWGQGLGRILMETIIAWARAEGLRKLYLRVFDDNDRAIALYDSLGFVQQGRLTADSLRVDGRYSDTIIMSLTLGGG